VWKRVVLLPHENCDDGTAPNAPSASPRLSTHSAARAGQPRLIALLINRFRSVDRHARAWFITPLAPPTPCHALPPLMMMMMMTMCFAAVAATN